jgi:hypothetical protein
MTWETIQGMPPCAVHIPMPSQDSIAIQNQASSERYEGSESVSYSHYAGQLPPWADLTQLLWLDTLVVVPNLGLLAMVPEVPFELGACSGDHWSCLTVVRPQVQLARQSLRSWSSSR